MISHEFVGSRFPVGSSAIINSGFDFPKERVLISLSPADLKKEGAGFDLAMALAVLINPIEDNLLKTTVLVMGELELSRSSEDYTEFTIKLGLGG